MRPKRPDLIAFFLLILGDDERLWDQEIAPWKEGNQSVRKLNSSDALGGGGSHRTALRRR